MSAPMADINSFLSLTACLNCTKKRTALPPSAEREKIDEIVYGLYGVTDEERKIVEGK